MAFKTLGVNRGAGLNGDTDVAVTAGAAPGTADVELQFVTGLNGLNSRDREHLLTVLAGYLRRHPEALD